ncbi:Inner membrane protein YebS [Aquimixticola soesokkakensis]|uniref:Inner membrane protein YebS n=1 Tax=Aquimixticola soesokkakensis TaxID=1519096 RepID=A0A1Y5RWF6_9RHOB|nr:paraquat-inducible protein A [Aquimixticola soesokkakensis]SLN24456.1 Inner membrane protein YebS [Aquimixticola soesokkakensis]
MTQTPLQPIGQDDLIACPSCDALYHVRVPQVGERATCARCETVLIAPKSNAMLRIVALSITNLILVVSALFLPFLSISRAGFYNATSIMDAILAFAQGPMFLLSIAVGALIVVVPMARMLLTLYVVAPLEFGAAPLPRAAQAFRLFESLKPWSMAEIFVLGCGIALVKVADLATVDFGAAFWMMGVLVVVVLLQDNLMDRWSIWRALEKRA